MMRTIGFKDLEGSVITANADKVMCVIQPSPLSPAGQVCRVVIGGMILGVSPETARQVLDDLRLIELEK